MPSRKVKRQYTLVDNNGRNKNTHPNQVLWSFGDRMSNRDPRRFRQYKRLVACLGVCVLLFALWSLGTIGKKAAAFSLDTSPDQQTSTMQLGSIVPASINQLSFGLPFNLVSTGSDATSLRPADFDRDGNVDIAYSVGSSLEVAQNIDGLDGAWSTTHIVGTATDVIAVLATSDLNRNGRMDLATASGHSIELWGNPTDAFSDGWTAGASFNGTTGVALNTLAITDLDRDGSPDVIAGDDNGVVRLWQNPLGLQGDLTTAWVTVKQLPTLTGKILDMQVSDLDQDGKPDLIILSDESSPKLRLWRNPGPSFSSDWTESLDFLPPSVLSLPNASHLVVADLNRDSWPDIMVGDSAGGMQGWYNPGGTTFAAPWTEHIIIESTTGDLLDLVGVDLNSDGLPELVGLLDKTLTTISVWEQQDVILGTTGVISWTNSELGTHATSLSGLSGSDLDNDGDQDIIAAGQQGIAAWENQLPPWAVGFDKSGHSAGFNNDWIMALLAVDLDQDGAPDLVSGEMDSSIIARRNDGTPFEGAWITHEVGTVTDWWQLLALESGDLDNDGDIDLAAGYYYDHGPILWENDGDPFTGGWSSHEIGTQRVGALDIDDMNGDGRLDIVVGGGRPWNYEPSNDNLVTVWLAPQDPFSDTWQSVNVGLAYDSVLGLDVGDLDNDGDNDIVIGTYHALPVGDPENPVPRNQWTDAYQVRAFRNDGNDQWTEFNIGRDPEYETLGFAYHGFWGATVTDVLITDLDGDGDQDIVATERNEGDFMVMGWQNDGTPFSGELWIPSAIAKGEINNWLLTHIYWVDPGDFDRDGDIDLVAGSAEAEPYQVMVWENSGIAFGAVISDTAWIRHNVGVLGEETRAGDVADFDQDGDLDLVAGTFHDTASEIKLWENYLAPSLALAIIPDYQTITGSQPVSYTVTVTGLYGLDESVDLWVSGIPLGMEVSWSQDPISPPGQSVLTLLAPQIVLPQEYQLLAVALGETATGQVPFTVTVDKQLFPLFLPILLMKD